MKIRGRTGFSCAPSRILSLHDDGEEDEVGFTRIEDAVRRAFFADVAGSCGQQFLFAVADRLARSCEHIVYVVARRVRVHADGAASLQRTRNDLPARSQPFVLWQAFDFCFLMVYNDSAILICNKLKKKIAL